MNLDNFDIGRRKISNLSESKFLLLIELHNPHGLEFEDLWGIENIETLSKTKAECVYNLIDESLLYKPLVTNKKVRSNINIPFIIESEEIRDKFLEYTFMNNIVGFRTKTPFVYSDYKLIEPLRISLYNGISVKDTLHIVEVMKSFEQIYLKTKNV